ncbi:MAG: hypothetical protein D6695_07545 [Planctomycetota bacterium]|nr:MAG: hypothetical protein D6695_07545 [Planctomycetota bacterium]
MLSTRRAVPFLVSAIALAALLIAGCNIVAPIAYAVHGPGKVKKVTTLDPERSYVIFVDDPSNKVASRRLRSAIVSTAQDKLLAQGVVTNIIDGRSAFAAAAGERYGERMSVQEIGQSVHADVVIYALLTNFSLGEEIGTFRPTATLHVKLIESETGNRIWPPEEGTMYPLHVNMPQRPGLAPSTTAEIYKAQQELAEYTGTALAQMFYDVQVNFSHRRR